MDLTHTKILVTGASGFIGSRLCEVLVLGCGARDVTCVVRNMGRAARIGRLPVRMVRGDITDRAFVEAIVPGVDTVIHLATGGTAGIVHGTRHLAAAALRASVRRFVYMSSASVYGLTAKPEHARESAPLIPSGEPYCDAKLNAEKVISRFIAKGLPVVTLRPRIVFGPYSHGLFPLVRELQQGKLTLVDGGQGACNTVFIDNLVHAVLLAIENDDAVGQRFFVTDGEQITWQRFKTAFAEAMHVNPAIVEVASDPILRAEQSGSGPIVGNLKGVKNFLVSSELRSAFRRIPAARTVIDGVMLRLYGLPELKKLRIKNRLGLLDPSGTPSAAEAPDLRTTVLRESGTGYAQIDQARNILKYQPIVTFDQGVAITQQWLKFASC